MDTPGPDKPNRLFTDGVLYPDCHTWLVFIAALDLMLTWVVLHEGGYEANPLAEHVIDRYGLPGIVLFKFGLTFFVIAVSEFIGRRKHDLGRKLASIAVAFPATGVVAGAILLIRSSM